MSRLFPHQKYPLWLRFGRSFLFAARGIWWGTEERNMRFHLLVMVAAVAMGIWMELRIWEWLIVIICIGMVLSAELVNTAIEAVCNVLRDDLKVGYLATQKARDVAAGAVFVLTLTSVVVGLIIFIPKWLLLLP
jgi:diacylglycerol kinase